MRIILTGAAGFLGWHTRCRINALTDHDVVPITRETWDQLPSLAKNADAIIHIAGINRAEPEKVIEGNAALAEDVAEAIRGANRPLVIAFANSIQSGNDTPYGSGKALATEILQDAAVLHESVFVDVRLPNLFGENGRPRYNSFVATFIEACIQCESPQISDRQIELLHAQEAAQALIDGLSACESRLIAPTGHLTTVQKVWEDLCGFRDLYALQGEIPPFNSYFDIALFNTYRAALFPHRYPIALSPRSDARGRLIETVRSHGGQGQSFVSTTVPGASRGDHFHLAKIERFAVLAGEARIALRRLFSSEIVEFRVNGDKPVAIDMPTMWTHSITNVGATELLTQFWTNELFDPQNPDTFWVGVDSKECSE